MTERRLDPTTEETRVYEELKEKYGIKDEQVAKPKRRAISRRLRKVEDISGRD